MTNEIESYRWQPVSTHAPRATATWLAARVLALLSHYYQPEVAEGVDEMAIADWIATLGDIPEAAIDGAAAEWLRSEERRPTPAGIRKLALARLEEPRKPPPPEDDEWPFGPVLVTADELARRREMAARVAEAFPILKAMPKAES